MAALSRLSLLKSLLFWGRIRRQDDLEVVGDVERRGGLSMKRSVHEVHGAAREQAGSTSHVHICSTSAPASCLLYRLPSHLSCHEPTERIYEHAYESQRCQIYLSNKALSAKNAGRSRACSSCTLHIAHSSYVNTDAARPYTGPRKPIRCRREHSPALRECLCRRSGGGILQRGSERGCGCGCGGSGA
jgi:hypothetical protein